MFKGTNWRKFTVRNLESYGFYKGGQNSKFFHANTLVRKRHNIINAIYDEANWVQSNEGIHDYFV